MHSHNSEELFKISKYVKIRNSKLVKIEICEKK